MADLLGYLSFLAQTWIGFCSCGEDEASLIYCVLRALSSVEEHFLHTEGVAGSSPAARTTFIG